MAGISRKRRLYMGEVEFDNFFSSHTAALRNAQLPLVPYLEIFMQEMVFIEDSNPDFWGIIQMITSTFTNEDCWLMLYSSTSRLRTILSLFMLLLSL
jgi:hypothetical protein